MNKGIVARIQEVIEHYGLTVSALADSIGVQRSSVSHLLNGRNKPSLDFVMKLSETYPEVDLYWLLYGKGSFPANEESNSAPTPSYDETLEKEQHGQNTSFARKSVPSPKQPIKVVMFFGDGTFESFDVKK